MSSDPDSAAFWPWFAAHADRLQRAVYGPDPAARDAALDELREAASDVSEEELVLEIGRPPGDGPGQLVVSADGHLERVDAVKAFVADAPDLPGWEVTAFRPRTPIGESLEIVVEDERVGPADIRFAVAEDADGLALTLYVRGLGGGNARYRGVGASLLAQHAVGERDALTLLSSVDTQPMPADATGLRLFADLPAVLDAARHDRYPPPGRLPPADEWATGTGTMGDQPVILLLRTGLRAVAGHPLYDRRLTVTFPFESAGPNGMPEDDDEFAAACEAGDAVAEALEAGQQSLHALTLTGRGERQVTFYTADPGAALDRLAAVRAEGLGRPFDAEVEWDSYWGMYRSFVGDDEDEGDEDEEDGHEE